MYRRELIGMLGVLLAGCSDLGVGSQYIDDHSWNGNGELALTLAEDHDTDGFSISHEHHEDGWDRAIVIGASPEFSGPVELPFRGMLADADTTFPTPGFTVDLWNGEFSEWDAPMKVNVAQEHLGSYEFEVPEAHRPPGSFKEG